MRKEKIKRMELQKEILGSKLNTLKNEIEKIDHRIEELKRLDSENPIRNSNSF